MQSVKTTLEKVMEQLEITQIRVPTKPNSMRYDCVQLCMCVCVCVYVVYVCSLCVYICVVCSVSVCVWCMYSMCMCAVCDV